MKENLRVRLTIPSQQVQEGAFVVIDSSPWRFYGLVTDLQLGATDPRFADEQSETRFPPELARLLHGQTLFTNLEVLPALMREIGPELGTRGIPHLARSPPRGPAAAAGQDHPAAPCPGRAGAGGRYRRDLRARG